jgi:PAS domain S-box-containing protein
MKLIISLMLFQPSLVLLVKNGMPAHYTGTQVFNLYVVAVFIVMLTLTIVLLILIWRFLGKIKKNDELARKSQIIYDELLFQNAQIEHEKDELNISNRLYAFISQVNQDIVRVKDEETMFKNACSIALEFGKFKMAWIGIFDPERQKISVIAHSGVPDAVIPILTNASIQTNGPQDRVLKTGSHYICNDVGNDPELESWRPFVLQHDIRSCMVLPIKKSGNIIGTLNLYSFDINFSKEQEIKLLVEVASDISFALDAFEKERLHKALEEQLIINEGRFRALVEKSADMVTLSTANGQLLYGSVSVTKVLGYSMAELLNLSVFDLIHPDDIAYAVENKDKILLIPGNSFYYIQRRRHKNGKWIWCEGTLTNMLHEPGIHAMVSNFRDITGKKIAEQKSHFEKNNLDALINNTNDLMWSVDREFNLITSNKPFDNMVKIMSGNKIMKGHSVLSAGTSTEQSKRYKAYYERAFAGETFTEIEYTPLPVKFWSEISYHPIREGHEVMGTACHSRNITQEKLAEKHVFQSEARLKEAQAITHIGNFEVNMDNYSETWSDEMYNIFGIARGDHVPSKELFLSFIHPDDADDVKDEMDEASQKLETSATNFRFTRKDGMLRYGSSEARFELDEKGVLIRIFGIVQDITERILGEKERVKIVSDLVLRNNDLEQFAYIISHNLRAPIANIIGASTALNDIDTSNEDKIILKKSITTSILKLDDVVGDLNLILQVKSNINETKEVVNFTDLVEDIKISIKNLVVRGGVSIKCNFSEFDQFLTIKSYMYSIFYNIITNSVKYCKPDIECNIEIVSRVERNTLKLIFTDNGLGIDLCKKGDEVFGLYKRFHTHIEGKGMGLYMVKTQVEMLGGKISVKSEENVGTEFIIEFVLND